MKRCNEGNFFFPSSEMEPKSGFLVALGAHRGQSFGSRTKAWGAIHHLHMTSNKILPDH